MEKVKESTEFLILDTIKKNSTIMPLFTAGYPYSKVINWVYQLEKEGKICYDEMEQRVLSENGLARWKIIKKRNNKFSILPLNDYKIKKMDIDEIYLP